MKQTEYEEVMRDTPRFVPVFTVVRVPKWVNSLFHASEHDKDLLHAGDRVDGTEPGTFKTRHGWQLKLPVSSVKFFRYRMV